MKKILFKKKSSKIKSIIKENKDLNYFIINIKLQIVQFNKIKQNLNQTVKYQKY